MKDITTEEAVKILKDIPFYEQVENHGVKGPRYFLITNNRLKQARDIVLKELNSKKGTINALKIALKERTDERNKKDEIINKKDKIINAMAEEIADHTKSCPLKIFGKGMDCDTRCDTDIKKDCWKLYFEKEVTE